MSRIRKQIGKHARYLEEQKERFLTLINEPDFIQQGYKLNYETWQDTLLAELDKLTENVPYENHDYYQDVESVTFELVDAIAYSDSLRRRSDFKEKVKISSVYLTNDSLHTWNGNEKGNFLGVHRSAVNRPV